MTVEFGANLDAMNLEGMGQSERAALDGETGGLARMPGTALSATSPKAGRVHLYLRGKAGGAWDPRHRNRTLKDTPMPDKQDIPVPADVQEYGDKHGVPTLVETAYRSGFVDGSRTLEAERKAREEAEADEHEAHQIMQREHDKLIETLRQLEQAKAALESIAHQSTDEATRKGAAATLSELNGEDDG
ncbi:hypothetical protein [Oricola sp.]|uniref:hypothetical protein n=1 Tax=Oricola sp. TaxID=1979950 RepID=UPI003BAD19BD